MTEKAGLGIAIGDSSSYVAVAKDGKSNVVANAGGDRCTPSVIAFVGENEFSTGVDAKNGAMRNPTQTLHHFHSLLGKQFGDASVQEVIESCTASVIEKKSLPYYEVEDGDRSATISAVRATTELIKALRETATDALRGSTADLALAVPVDFTPPQTDALKAAAHAAGFKNVTLIKEPIAALLAYNVGQDGEKCHDANVLVYDAGECKTQATVVAVRSGMYHVLGTVSDRSVCGSKIDDALVSYFVTEFKKQAKVDVSEQRRPMMKLRAAADSAKRILSAQPSTSVSVESLADGRDFTLPLIRSRFEILNSDVLSACTQPIAAVLEQCKLQISDIHAVILAGGLSNVVKIKGNIAKLFKQEIIHERIVPEEVFAVGAALHASQYFNQDSPVEIQAVDIPVVPFDICLATPAGPVSVIDKLTPLPLRRIVHLTTDTDNQSSIQITLCENRGAENTPTVAALTLTGLPAAPQATLKISVIISIETNGSLKVKATESTSNQSATFPL